MSSAAFGAPPSSEGEYPRFSGSGIEGDTLRAGSDVSLQSSGLALRVGRLQRRIRIRVVDRGTVLSHADRVTRASFVPHCQLAAVTATSQGVGALYAGASAAEDSLESEAEVLAEEGVDTRVYRRITVS